MTLSGLLAVILGGQRKAVAHDNDDECDGSLLYTDVLSIVGTPGVRAGLYGVAGSDNELVPFNASAAFQFCANPCFAFSTLNRTRNISPVSSEYSGPPFAAKRENLAQRIADDL